MMNVMLFNTVCFGIEFFKITFLLLFFYGTNFVLRKKFYATMLTAFIAVGVISYFIDLNEIPFGYTVILLVSFAIIQNDKSSILFVFIMYMYICIIDMSINGLLMYIFDLTVEKILDDHLLYAILNMPSLLIFASITIIRLVRGKYVFNEYIKGHKLLLVVSGAVITFYTTSIQLTAFSDMSKEKLRFTSIALSLGSVIFIFILAELNRNRIENQYLKNENFLVNRMLRNQEKYYLMLLEKENTTKAFRHDMEYHLMCMHSLYKENKLDEYELYFEKFIENFKELKMDFDTGSSLINAILNDISAKFSDIHLKCSGHFYDNVDISPYDICTIFFNILKNAYEAAEKTEKKRIELIIGYSGANLLIKLKNSALRRPVIKGNRYISDKKEKGHGYGLQNVCSCVERLGGTFSMSYFEGEVVVEIILFGVLPTNDESDARHIHSQL